MADQRFAKYHGTGNDFVLLADPGDELDLTPEQVQRLCDRHTGVGADGVIRVSPPATPGADYFMDYRNADGSLAEMCGNGVRCLVAFVHDEGLSAATDLAIETRAGVHQVHADLGEGGRVERVRVDMGPPSLGRAQADISVNGTTVTASEVSMGNPHLVVFLDRDPDDDAVLGLGPLMERHERFPDRTNVEFISRATAGRDETIDVRVWERGIGETMACGSGACAVLVAAEDAGLVAGPMTVRFPGGEVEVERREGDGHILLTGPAVKVFDGMIAL